MRLEWFPGAETYYRPDSFMAGHQRQQWLFDGPFVDRMERYVQALLNHRNRYTGQAYRDELVRGVVNRLAKAIRDTGSRKPVVWNLNWPGMITGHEDVFQAVADSTVDAVSFCLYPGQSDVPSHYWDHPTDLSGRNYLPYLGRCYRDYDALRWLLGRRFAGKAKVTYEFETFFNQSSYLYPAMARLLRALGSQMAMMWQYTLSPPARYCGGSHYLNLQGSPQKALSFRIASRAFGELPRYADYDARAQTEMVFGHAAISYPNNLSVFSSDETLFYSRSFDVAPLPIGRYLREIAGSGRSPLVSYEGTGAYFLRVEADRIELLISPDVAYPRPLWQGPGRPPWTPTCELDSQTAHRFAIHLPAWEGNLKIQCLTNGPSPPKPMPAGSAELTAGRYRISRAP